MDRPLKLLLKHSRIARYYCVVVILLSWLAIGLADLSLALQIPLGAIVATYGWHAIRQLRTLPFVSLEYRNQRWFVCVDDDFQMDSLHAAELQQNIFIGAGMIALSFQLPTGKKIRAVLWPDSADADSLRQLRAVLLARA